MGEKYKFSLWDYMFASGDPARRRKDNTEEGIFCSQLIAMVYQHMGIMREDVGAGKFLPGAFAAGSALPFIGDAGLGTEYLIDFFV